MDLTPRSIFAAHPDGYTLRLAGAEDAEAYYQNNFNPLDPEVARLTGSKTTFSREEVVEHFRRCTVAPDRYDFLIHAPDGRIVGESVLNEIDWGTKSANYRIAIFHREHRNRGIGSWALEKTLELGFSALELRRVTLTVFPCNHRARHIYEKAGFRPIQMLTGPDEIEMELTR